jgi:hypothetical protein
MGRAPKVLAHQSRRSLNKNAIISLARAALYGKDF